MTPDPVLFRRFIQFLSLFIICACNENRATVELQFCNPNGSTSPEITAEVVATPAQQQLGLMYRKDLAPNAGMLFVFPDETPRTFWMKNTLLELDMVFVDRAFRVVSIVKRAVPLTESPRMSEQPAKYVLEVRGGSAEAWEIVPGSLAVLRGEIPKGNE